MSKKVRKRNRLHAIPHIVTFNETRSETVSQAQSEFVSNLKNRSTQPQSYAYSPFMTSENIGKFKSRIADLSGQVVPVISGEGSITSYGKIVEVKDNVVHLQVDNDVTIKVDKAAVIKDMTDAVQQK